MAQKQRGVADAMIETHSGISAAAFLAQLCTKDAVCLFQRVTEFNSYLAGVPYPPPFADRRPAAKKIRLQIEDVIAVQIALGIALLQSCERWGHGYCTVSGY